MISDLKNVFKIVHASIGSYGAILFFQIDLCDCNLGVAGSGTIHCVCVYVCVYA